MLGIVLLAASFRFYGRLDQPLSHYAPKLAASCWAALNAPVRDIKPARRRS
jgi:hypothetical protein